MPTKTLTARLQLPRLRTISNACVPSAWPSPINCFDANGDGKLIKAEIESLQKKLFALLDSNDNGEIVQDEIPNRHWHGGNGKC